MTSELAADIEACASAHRRLLDHIDDLSDEQAGSPSLLPGWTVGHVITHLARNADSVVHRIEGALRNEIVDQYPGGTEAKFAAIEDGAHRPATELISDVTAASAAVDSSFKNLDPDCWERPSRHGSGHIYPVAVLPFRRWREVEVHMVDLGLGYTPDAWPPRFAERWLPSALENLAARTAPTALLAWVLRRGEPPPLSPY